MRISKYDLQAIKFLKAHNIQFRAIATCSGNCPPFCDGKKHVHGKEHLILFNRQGKGFSLMFWNSYNDAQNGKLPKAYDVLACITKSEPGSFSDFCAEYGYNEDSRKDEKIYNAVCEEWEKIKGFFTPEELKELQEIN